jgi:hypothetical protein
MFAATGAACSAVLGLDAPTLDPCASGGCADGTATGDGDVTLPKNDAGVDAAEDAAAVDASDAQPVFDDVVVTNDGNGVRCGSATADMYCAPPAICCLTNGAGPAYTCVADVSLCAGYPIECATYNDCAGTDVCCAYGSAMKCEPENTASCANLFVCDPTASPSQCQSGWTCTGTLVRSDAGVTIPYDVCVQ